MVTTTSAALNFQIQKIMDQFYADRAKLNEPAEEADIYDKDPPRNVRSFRQNTNDERADSLQTARDIGNLTRGKTRLNIVSALTKDDLVDFYKFKVTKEGKLAISITTDSSLSIQLIKRNGAIVADSEAAFGEKAANFEKLGTGKLDVSTGDYYLKVTRATGQDRSLRPNYAIQLSMSKYFEEDYDTVESPAARGAASLTSVRTQNAGALSDVLNTFAGGNLFDILI